MKKSDNGREKMSPFKKIIPLLMFARSTASEICVSIVTYACAWSFNCNRNGSDGHCDTNQLISKAFHHREGRNKSLTHSELGTTWSCTELTGGVKTWPFTLLRPFILSFANDWPSPVPPNDVVPPRSYSLLTGCICSLAQLPVFQ